MMTPKLLLLFPWLAGLVAAAQNKATTKVTFLHVNDHHSHYFETPLDLTGDTLPPGLSSDIKIVRAYYGGAARTLELRNSLMQQAKAAGHDVIRTHGGNAVRGTVFFTFFGSQVDAKIMNTAGFDAMVLGNSELDNGDSFAAAFVESLDVPVTVYNLRPHNGSALLSLPTNKTIRKYITIKLSDGTKLGICGLLDQKTIENQLTDAGTVALPEGDAAKACVADLEALNINKIAILSQLGYSLDQSLLGPMMGIDVVLGGYSDTLLGNSSVFAKVGLQTDGPFAQLAHGKCIIQAWEYFKALGALTVEFDNNGTVVSCTGQTYLALDTQQFTIMADAYTEQGNLTSSDAQLVANYLLGFPMFVAADEDPAVASIVSSYSSRLDSFRGNVIGTVPQNLCTTDFGGLDLQGTEQLCPDLDLLKVGGAACYLAAYAFLHVTPTAEIGFQNLGGCSANILAGDFTYGEAFDFLPYNNLLVTLTLTGDQVRRALEDGYNAIVNNTVQSGNSSLGEGFPLAAGLTWHVDYNKPFGQRVSNIEVNRRLQAAFEPIDPAAKYILVTNNYLAAARQGYYTFGEVDQNDPNQYVNTYAEYAQSFIDYVEYKQTIEAAPLDQWSTQYVVFPDGSVVDLITKFQQEQRQQTQKGSSSGTSSLGRWWWLLGLIIFGACVISNQP